DSYPSGNMVTGPDGNLWFTEQGDFNGESTKRPGKIGRILPHAPYTITEFDTSHPQDRPRPYGLIVGPDRNLYYTENGNVGVADIGGSVGRITPFGSDARIQASATEIVPKVTPCPRGTGICDLPRYMTVGPDHNIWIASTFDIDRLTVPEYH